MGVSAMRDAIDACELTGSGIDGTGFASRVLLLSAVYMTATFVDGEFMVPVRDHPIATY